MALFNTSEINLKALKACFLPTLTSQKASSLGGKSLPLPHILSTQVSLPVSTLHFTIGFMLFTK